MASIQERRTQDGQKRYRVQIRILGRPPVTKTFSSKTLAKQWVSEQEDDIRRGLYFKNSEADRHTFSETVERYVRDVLPEKPKSADDSRRHLEWWNSQFGHRRMSDISTALIVEHRDQLRSGFTPQGNRRSGSTVNRYLGSISHLFSVAVKEWEWCHENPVTRVSRLKEPRGRVRFLEDDDRERLLEVCKESPNQYLYTIVLLALTTGMRKSEILGLRWDDVDLQRRSIIIRDSKNGETRSVPIASHVDELLSDHSKVRRIDTNLLFPGKRSSFGDVSPSSIRTAWESALKKARITDFRFHDLRHSCASYLAMNGATTAELAAVLGHKTLAMVKRYSHLSDEHVSGIVERTALKVLGSE